MAEPNSGRRPLEAFCTVRNLEQARLLSAPESVKYFEPFLARERTVSEAAAEVGCTLDTMLYRVKTFLGAGLLEVVRLEKRAGRPIKHYRSSADAYFIPFKTTSYAELEERIREQHRPYEAMVARALARSLRASGSEGQRIYRTPQGEVFRQSATDEGVNVNFEDWESLRRHVQDRLGSVTESAAAHIALTDEEAKALLLELYGLWRRYEHKGDVAAPVGRPYLLQFALLPLEPDDLS